MAETRFDLMRGDGRSHDIEIRDGRAAIDLVTAAAANSILKMAENPAPSEQPCSALDGQGSGDGRLQTLWATHGLEESRLA